MSFSVLYDKNPCKFLERIDRKNAERIIDKIEEIFLELPVPHGAKRIFGEKGVYRIRIGDYRALYRVNFTEKKIVIFKIDKREKVYD